MSLAIVLENSGAASHGIDQQVQVAVAVNVGENRAGRILVSTTDPGGVGDVLKSPIAKIAEEFVVAIEAAEVEVAKAVAIDIPERDPGAAQQIAVGNRSLIRNEIRKKNPGGFRQQESEASLARRRHRQLAPAIAGTGLPIQARASGRGLVRKQQEGGNGHERQLPGGSW